MTSSLKQVNLWRQAYNPLRALSMTKVVTMLDQAEQGYYADLMWLYRYIEKRDATLRSVKGRRLSAVKKLDWSIKVKEGSNAKKAEKQKQHMDDFFNGIQNLRQAIAFFCTAEFRGFAHLEKNYRNNRESEGVWRLEPVEQWYWARKYPSTNWLYNKTAMQTNQGIPIDLKHFVIRECDSPVDEVAVIAFMRKNLSQKDWDGFIETYGIPPLFVELTKDATPKNATEVDEWQSLAESVISNGRGVLPAGAKLATLTDGAKGGNTFEGHLRYQDEQIVMAGTGGLLTVLNGPTGMGSGQSESHAATFNEIAVAEAMDVSEAFNSQLLEPEIGKEFPNDDVLVYFELAAEDIDESGKVVDDAGKLKTAGYKIVKEQVEEKTGYKLEEIPDPNAAMIGGGAPAGGAPLEQPLMEGDGGDPEAGLISEEEDPFAMLNRLAQRSNRIIRIANRRLARKKVAA